MNIRVLTHTDLDGISCGIIIKKLFKDDNVSITYTNYNEIEKVLNDIRVEMFDDINIIDKLFITDLSLNETQVKLLKKINEETKTKVIYIDHHNTTYNSKETFQILNTENSATKILYNYLVNENSNIIQNIKKFIKIYNNAMKEYAEAVSLWDTFKWKENPENKLSKLAVNLDRCFKYMGGKEFVKKILCLEFDKMCNFELPTLMKFISEVEEIKINKLCEYKNSHLKKIYIDFYKVGFITAEGYESYLSDYILNNNDDIDYVMIYKIDSRNVSFRSRNDSDVDVSEIAKRYGGGGHIHASGCSVDNISHDVMETIRDILI